MSEEESDVVNQNYYMQKEIANLYQNRKFSDCTFFVGDEKILAHKLILALNSPVFEQMLFGPLSSNEVEITDIETVEFRQMLEYIYLHKVIINSIPNAWRLLYASRKYFLNELYQLCITYILNNLNISNLLLSYEYADFFNLKPIFDKCQNDITHFPVDVFSSNYHMKPNTFIAVLLLICPHVPVEYIQTLINKWAVEECEIQNLADTEYNKLKILQKAGICKLVLFNEMYKDVDKKKESSSTMPQFHYLRFRHERKVDRLINFKYDCTFKTQVKVNRTVLTFGVALQIGEAQVPCLLNCLVTLAIIKNGDKVYGCKSALSSGYIKFPNSVTLSADETYTFIVTYYLDIDAYGSITTYFMDPYLKNQKNGIVFEFLDDAKGGVLQGISFYLV